MLVLVLAPVPGSLGCSLASKVEDLKAADLVVDGHEFRATGPALELVEAKEDGVLALLRPALEEARSESDSTLRRRTLLACLLATYEGRGLPHSNGGVAALTLVDNVVRLRDRTGGPHRHADFGASVAARLRDPRLLECLIENLERARARSLKPGDPRITPAHAAGHLWTLLEPTVTAGVKKAQRRRTAGGKAGESAPTRAMLISTLPEFARVFGPDASEPSRQDVRSAVAATRVWLEENRERLPEQVLWTRRHNP